MREAIRELLDLEEDAELAFRRFPEPVGWLQALRNGYASGSRSAAIAALEALQPPIGTLEQAGLLHSRTELEAVLPGIR